MSMESIADSMWLAVKSYLDKPLAEIAGKFADLEVRIASIPGGAKGEPGPKGDDGRDGKDAIAKDGRDGKDADTEMVRLLIEQAVAKAVAALPAPKDGKDGAKGEPGKDGNDGKDGAPGLDGKNIDLAETKRIVLTEWVPILSKAVADIPKPNDGKDGERGIAGKDGAPGKDGPSSFVINEAGHLLAVYPSGTTQDIGEVHGKDGIRGASIMDGSVDADGNLVIRMSDGRILNVGQVRGINGKPGERGIAGERGRDAHELHILPGIDQAKSYAGGTCARYRGGMIIAERPTDPVSNGDIAAAGWAVMLEGIDSEDERALNDGRLIERTTVYTSGRTFVRTLETAAMIYRGTWKAGHYDRGDTVTRDGSTWHCQRSTDGSPGNGTDDWKLCVKRGADGKDGLRGPHGMPGKDKDGSHG